MRDLFRTKKTLLSVLFFILIAVTPTFSYVGPGIGISLIGSLWAVLVALALAIGGLLIWPIRALIRRRKKSVRASGDQSISPEGGEK
jgi:membrane-bound ClpP family serine protease